MGRKKEVVLTEEERLERMKQSEITSFGNKSSNIPEPNYTVEPGMHFKFGGFKDCVVDESVLNGKGYGCFCETRDKGKIYRVIPWMYIKPDGGDTDFARNREIRLIFSSTDIDELLSTYYGLGIDTEPDYQRDYVWDDSDRELLIDSIFNNISIGGFVLNNLSDSDYFKRGKSYEIVDGKQRLLTIAAYFENKFPYKGKYFNDLSQQDRLEFKKFNLSIAKVHESNKKEILKLFLMLNRTGKTMDNKHLEKVEKMMETGS